MKNVKQLSVFIVDDEQIIANTLALILQRSGYLAKAFFNPLEALAAAHLETPDLIISDVVMPQLSGVELALELKTLCPSCKIILFSGQAHTDDFLLSVKEQEHNFPLLAKPMHPLALLRQISLQTAMA